jgi:hypothetical protein
MKHSLVLLFVMVIFCSDSVSASQLKEPDLVNTKTHAPGKKNIDEKKSSNTASGKEITVINQKIKKDSAAQNKDFYGPLSWKPALLF